MNTEIELRKWLNRTDVDLHSNLSFGMKVWHSMELALPTKHEIVLDELCKILPSLASNLVKSDAASQQNVWDIIIELLSLTYSTGAVNVQIKAKLIDALSDVANYTLRKSAPSVNLLNALRVTLHNTSMLNYFKSSGHNFAKFVAINLRYLIAWTVHEGGIDTNRQVQLDTRAIVDGLLKSLRSYIRQTPYLDTFKEFFATDVFVALSELVILLQCKHNIHLATDFIAILQELFFDGSQTKELKQFLQNASRSIGDATNFSRIFQVPIHAHLLTVETVLISFKNDTDIIMQLFKYLFDEKLTAWTTIIGGKQELLNCVTYFIYLLKKHDVSLNFEIDKTKAHVFLGTIIEALVYDNHEQYPLEVMNIVCAALRLNALILEHTAVQIAVKFMLIPKVDEKLCRKYEELMSLLIEMFRKLCRAEKLISQLIKNIWETLSTVKLSKKLKRRLNQSFVDDVSPSKVARSDVDFEADNCQVKDNKKISPQIDYFDLIREDIESAIDRNIELRSNVKQPSSANWSEIAFAFPPFVAAKYTKLISGLVSKPSLVIWKTLIFSLKDYVNALHDDVTNSENTIFLIEMTCALLSQYFIGSRLAEHADKSWDSIESNRKQTYEVLAQFGHVIINQEHNYRTMNAFLKLCINVSNFDLVCWYYCPDSMCGKHSNLDHDNGDHADNDEGGDESDTVKINGFKNAQDLHSYLSLKEWTIIEQRITNFGKRDCKSNINQIYLQRVKATFLFREDSAQCMREDIARSLLSSTFTDIEQITGILSDDSAGPWFIQHLESHQKRMICELILDTDDQDLSLLYNERIQDKEYINVLILITHKFVIRELCAGKKANSLKSLPFETLFENNGLSTMAQNLVQILTEYSNGIANGINKIKQESHDHILRYMDLLASAPIGFCSEEVKNVLTLFNIIIYHNFKSAGDDLLCSRSLDIFRKILHFDNFPAIFRYIHIKNLIQLFSNTIDFGVFDMIFDRVAKNLNEDNCKMLNHLLDICVEFQIDNPAQHEVLLNIGVIAVVQLSKNKKAKEYFDKFRHALLDIIKRYFASKLFKKEENVTEFVTKTLSAFVIIIKTMVSKAPEDIDEQLANITKKYLRNSVNCRNVCSVKLLNVVLNNKIVLRYDDAELKEIVDDYWANFRDCCLIDGDSGKSESDSKLENHASLETVLKLIFDFKSTEDWIQLLNEFDEDIRQNLFTAKGQQNHRILSYMSKCQFNKVKGQIYSEFYKQVTLWTLLTLRAKENILTLGNKYVLNLIRNHIIIINNVQIPVSIDLIDDILSFMVELNVKKFDFLGTDLEQSAYILREMIELTQSLINQRHIFIMDRVAQFVHVFKDELQAVCWYKSQRAKTDNLDAAEITILAEMAHNLEKISKSLVSHVKEVKRVAPYILVFIINLMISNDRPLTLYPKIKTHFEYICYDLIAICDHRVDSFILRCCNEASKPVYENLVKEYQKYHKFKGKV